MYIQKISSDISAKSLFQDIPDISFSSQHVICPHCNCVLHVQKTLRSTPITMDIGAFHAKETILQCPNDKTIFHSERLRKLTPAKGTFGFDPNYTASAQNRIIFVETRLQIIDFTISKKIAPQNIWCGKYFKILQYLLTLFIF